MRKLWVVVGAVAALTAGGVATPVEADGVYRTQHIDLQALDGAPLRSGSVTNIHANGPVVYALEQYHVNGAAPRTTYEVMLELYVLDPQCSGDPAGVLPTASFTTNGAGNGHGKARFAPQDVAPFPKAPAVHGVNWVLMDGTTAAYETGCQQVVLD